jgi:hypothetical protein
MPERMRWQNLVLGSMALLMLAGCAAKPGGQAAQSGAQTPAAGRGPDEAWMRGSYQACPPELRRQLGEAVDNLETAPAHQVGLYQMDASGQAWFDGESNGENVHLSLRHGDEAEPWEFFLLQDRFYSQEQRGLRDHGPDSRADGEKLYLPLYKKLRVFLKQGLNGEYRDLGPAEFGGLRTHKYDFRAQEPDREAPVLTVMLEVDESRRLVVHAVVGNGTGSDTGSQRFAKAYFELALGKIGEIAPVELPAGVEILPPVKPEKDIDETIPALP